ncbi:hypothetical protein GCM10009792_04930 [Microcella alkalica]|uniref:Nucleotidyltransferase family protein n=1 Tax=Microcella alkalica TaxID=355930 RepID=A0A839EC94_9MICO|nr:hypothetical protein [Microcella alkalica]MBA8848816.1 hypothetical protein [Microcella alkalica]
MVPATPPSPGASADERLPSEPKLSGPGAGEPRRGADAYRYPSPETPELVARHACMSGVVDLMDDLGIRALLAGNIVFPPNGLGAPTLRAAFNLIVDPSTCRRLAAELVARGWVPARIRRFGVLPPAVFALHEPESGTLLNLFPLIPGFFTDPQTVFEHAWGYRGEMIIFDRRVPHVDRLLTMVLSVHDNLGPRAAAPSPESETGPLIDRFAALITNEELERLPRLVRGVGAEGVMRRLFDGLGLRPAATRLPSRRYAEARFGIPGATVAGRMLLRAIESSPGYTGHVARDVWAARWSIAPRLLPELARLVGFVLRARRARRRLLRSSFD